MRSSRRTTTARRCRSKASNRGTRSTVRVGWTGRCESQGAGGHFTAVSGNPSERAGSKGVRVGTRAGIRLVVSATWGRDRQAGGERGTHANASVQTANAPRRRYPGPQTITPSWIVMCGDENLPETRRTAPRQSIRLRQDTPHPLAADFSIAPQVPAYCRMLLTDDRTASDTALVLPR